MVFGPKEEFKFQVATRSYQGVKEVVVCEAPSSLFQQVIPVVIVRTYWGLAKSVRASSGREVANNFHNQGTKLS